MVSIELTKSIHGKIWQQKPISEPDIAELCRSTGINDFLAKILYHRIDNLNQAMDFLFPRIKNLLPDPFHLLDMQKAVDRTAKAITHQEKICIFADYDVDGATSSSLLKNIFRDLGHHSDIYVPDRLAEGYGPTPAAMQKIKDNGVLLLITVDCGAMAHDALKYAKEVGLDVIVIDHHISSEVLPDAVAVVNPNRIDETSPYKHLAAVGVSFLFATALVSYLKKIGYFNAQEATYHPEHSLCHPERQQKISLNLQSLNGDPSANLQDDTSNSSYMQNTRPIPNLMKYLDLVALGTVCDVMKLTNLNRAFVAQGLKVMLQRQNIGIKTLYDIAGVGEKPTCYHLGFMLGPRINAGGRVGKSSLGATLLSTECSNEARTLAEELEKHNNERKTIELSMLEEAIEIAETQKNDNLLFIAKEGWHPGVIGIVAGRLKEKFNKPVAVIALNDGIGKASCRSVRNVDFGSKIINAKSKNLIVVGGGHAMAAGFTVLQDKLKELHQFLNESFKQDDHYIFGQQTEEYDILLTTNSVNFELMEDLHKLEPFGPGNPEPIFKFANLYVLSADIVGHKHIKCLLAPSREAFGSKILSAIAFNAVSSPLEHILLSPKSNTFSVLGPLKMNNWQERYSIQLHIKDLII